MVVAIVVLFFLFMTPFVSVYQQVHVIAVVWEAD